MDNIQKLLSDIDRLKKHDRAEHNNDYDGQRVCKQINRIFTNSNSFLGETAAAFVSYWYSTYIEPSADIKNEPTQEHLDKLVAIQSILDGSEEQTDCLSHDDWQELCNIVNSEAEDIPLDALNQLMAIFVDRQIF